MNMHAFWHGGLSALSLLAVGAVNAGPRPTQSTPVQSRTFAIEYRVNDAALPLDVVELWYTCDAARTWHNYGLDEDAQSPIKFTAPAEGQYGFFIVVSNAAGVSTEPPGPETRPRQWAFVDYTPPVVQLHPVRAGATPDERKLHLKWTAIDAHLATRPVELAYRELAEEPWCTIAPAVANTGRYDWSLPESVVGRIMVRVSARDRGGNRTDAVKVVDVDAMFPPKAGEAPAGDNQTAKSAHPRPTPAEVARAKRLCERGVWHRARGEHRLAVSRLRDALTLDPTLSEALVEMGKALYAVHDFDASFQAYELALAQTPRSRVALEGIAEASVALNQYDTAVVHLRSLLRARPKDAAAWLHLGDVQMRRGDEISARDSYATAASVDPDAADVIAKAQARLANMDLVRERVGQLVERPEASRP